MGSGESERRRHSGRWWGDLPLSEEHPVYLRLGPFELWLQVLDAEWRVGHRRLDLPLDETHLLLVGAAASPPADGPPIAWNHVAFGDEVPLPHVRPRLADRAIVVMPQTPLLLPPQQRVRLFVSTPLWLQLEAPPGALLTEMPMWRPSDTWFGTPIDGELCYAGRTRGRRRLEELERLPHRAITPLVLVNETELPLSIERVAVPVRNLSIYDGGDGPLWTEEVRLARVPHQPLARARLAKGAPPEAGEDSVLVAEPREVVGHSFSIPAFSELWGL